MSDDARLLTQLESSAAFERSSGNGCSMAWRRWGSGAPLVLLHGGHGSWRHWVRNIDALSQRHALLLPDLPGFGDSANIVGDPHAADRLPRLVDAVIASLDGLVGATTPVGLGGFSFGGLVAAHVAAQRPHVRALALLGPAGHGSRRRQSEPMRDWRVDDRAKMMAALRQNLQVLMLHDARRIDALALPVHEVSCRQTRFRSRAVSLAGSLKEALASFTAPVLAAWGRHDVTATPAAAGPLLCKDTSRRVWMVIEDAGHWVQYEQADAINAVLGHWFAGAAQSA